MTHEQRIEALREFGYNEREAAFLTLAALHSGYFVRRQYNRFVGRKHSTTVIQLVQRTRANRHSRATVFPNNASVYHLYSRPLYQALGDPNNRHRRRRAPLAIKTKLIALDFVLAHPNRMYLATEREKVDYFVHHRKISPDLLPKRIYTSKHSDATTVRYFVDKFPLFITSGKPDSPPVLTFGFIDAGARTLAGFRTYLEQYTPLFRQLGRFRLVYIATSERHFEAAECRFKALVQHLDTDKPFDPDAAEMVEYFRLEQLCQRKQFHALSKAQLIHLKKARRRFTSPELHSLFEFWKQGGDRAVTEKLEDPKPPRPLVDADFCTCHLEYRYDYLETFSRR